MLNDMTSLRRYLQDSRLLDQLAVAAAESKISCWLVGGALRDIVLGRPVTDIDIASVADPTSFARQWAKRQGGNWFWLDRERLQSRVLLRDGTFHFYFDFAPLRAPSIDQDLHLRDFSVNALALPLITPLGEQTLLDPMLGLEDLQAGILKQCSGQSLTDDPLRILKGIRHCTTLGFSLEQETAKNMKQCAHLLASSAGERKRTEFGRILSADDPIAGLSLLEEFDLLKELLGSQQIRISGSAWLDSWKRCTPDFTIWSQRLPKLFTERFDEVFSRKSLYLIVKILKEGAPEDVENFFLERLRFSRQSAAIVAQLVNLCQDNMLQLNSLPDSRRVRALWLHEQGRAAIDQLLYFAIVEQSGQLSPGKVIEAIEDYSELLVDGRIPALLSGGEIKRLFPELKDRDIGICQQRIKQAEIAGNVRSVEDAKDYLVAQNSIDKI